MTQKPNIGVPIEAIKGDRIMRQKVRDQISRWETRQRLVETQMAQKGFTEEEVDAAWNECEKMLEFYDDLLEKLE